MFTIIMRRRTTFGATNDSNSLFRRIAVWQEKAFREGFRFRRTHAFRNHCPEVTSFLSLAEYSWNMSEKSFASKKDFYSPHSLKEVTSVAGAITFLLPTQSMPPLGHCMLRAVSPRRKWDLFILWKKGSFQEWL